MTSEELSSELWDDLEGWNAGEGGRLQREGIHEYIRLTDQDAVPQKLSSYCETTIFQ